jgi:alpha-1,2-glucosyltransferase
LTLIASFAAFVVWNGGVVLGDKDNHVATINIPQMLYIWPAIAFFSWPVLLPLFSDLTAFRQRLPRLNTTISFTAMALAVINLNTVIHPFTLADNRHYTFYVFAIIRRHWLVRYALVPIYFICAGLVLGALGGATNTAPTHSKGIRILHGDDTVCVSFALVWLISTTLSLVAAPLVEPRYFLIPWLTWRLAVPTYVPPRVSTSQPKNALAKGLRVAAQYSGWIEFGWYMVVNLVTCYIFLYRGFSWPQEPGNTQRFMW